VPSPAKTSKLVDRDRLLLLFPLVPAVDLPVTCKATQQTQAVDFTFVSPFFLLDLPLSPSVNPFFFWVQRHHCLLPSEWLKMGEEAVAVGGVSEHVTMGLKGNRLKGLIATAG